MMQWLAVRTALGIPRWLLALFAILLISLGIFQAIAGIGRTIAASQAEQRDAGAATQRAQDLEITLERTEQGNAARNEIRDPRNSARYDQCLRSARTPANCQRFMPE